MKKTDFLPFPKSLHTRSEISSRLISGIHSCAHIQVGLPFCDEFPQFLFSQKDFSNLYSFYFLIILIYHDLCWTVYHSTYIWKLEECFFVPFEAMYETQQERFDHCPSCVGKCYGNLCSRAFFARVINGILCTVNGFVRAVVAESCCWSPQTGNVGMGSLQCSVIVGCEYVRSSQANP